MAISKQPQSGSSAEGKKFDAPLMKEYMDFMAVIRFKYDPMERDPLFIQAKQKFRELIAGLIKAYDKEKERFDLAIEEGRRKHRRACVYYFAKRRCLHCGLRIHMPKRNEHDDYRYEMDHVKDKHLRGVQFGPAEWLNVQPLCSLCHARKSEAAKHADYNWEDWDYRKTRRGLKFLAKCKRAAKREDELRQLSLFNKKDYAVEQVR